MIGKHIQMRNRERQYHFDAPGKPRTPRCTREHRAIQEQLNDLDDIGFEWEQVVREHLIDDTEFDYHMEEELYGHSTADLVGDEYELGWQ